MLSIWDRDPAWVAAAGRDRFIIGLGVSHPSMVDDYAKPYATLQAYLDGLDAAGQRPGARVLAANGPRMIKLAAARTAEALTDLVTAEQTAVHRAQLGPGALLAPMVKIVLETDPAAARATGRAHLATYLGLPNYRNNLLRMGFTADDLDGVGSDRLVDGLVMWGSLERVRSGIEAHRQAGADHVALHVLGGERLPTRVWTELSQDRRLHPVAHPHPG